MKIVFDKNTEIQRAVDISHFGESLLRKTLSAAWTGRLGEVSSVPAANALASAPSFATVEIMDGDGDTAFAVPVQGTYNVIRDVNVSYVASEQVYSMTLVLGYDPAK